MSRRPSAFAATGIAVTMLLFGCVEDTRAPPPEATPDATPTVVATPAAIPALAATIGPAPRTRIDAMFCQIDEDLTFVRLEACELLTSAFTLVLPPELNAALPMDSEIPYCLQPDEDGHYRIQIESFCALNLHSGMRIIDELWPAAVQHGLVNGDVLPWCDMGEFPDHAVAVGPPCVFGRSWPSIHVGVEGDAFVERFAHCSAIAGTLRDLERHYQPLIEALVNVIGAAGAEHLGALRALQTIRDDLHAYRFSARLDAGGSDGTVATHQRILNATDDVLNGAPAADVEAALELTEETASVYGMGRGCSY